MAARRSMLAPVKYSLCRYCRYHIYKYLDCVDMLSVHLATVPVSRMPSSGSSTTGSSEAASSGTASVLQNTATTTIVPPHLGSI